MIAIIAILSFLIPLSQQCLVVRTKECACPLQSIDNSNVNLVSDHPFYANISQLSLKTPIVSGDNCTVSVYCDGNYELVLLDNDYAVNFGEYSADGLCDRNTQTWMISDAEQGGFKTFHRIYAVCVRGKNDCIPEDDATLMFAYSNDLDPSVLEGMKQQEQPRRYSKFATIRFDTKQTASFEYSDNWIEVASYIDTHLPDPSLSFDSNNTGSDVLTIIEQFLDNTQVTVCGSQMFIIVKRYPTEIDISRIVSKMRQHHSYVTFIASKTPSGGSHPETLYDLATQTNGVCVFVADGDIPEASMYLTLTISNLLYAVNPIVSGKGSIQLPSLLVPNKDFYDVTMTIQDNGPFNVVRTALWSWSKENAPYSKGQLGIWNASHLYRYWYLGNYFLSPERFDAVSYNMKLDYEYNDSKSRRLQIRVRYWSPVDYWPPYDN